MYNSNFLCGYRKINSFRDKRTSVVGKKVDGSVIFTLTWRSKIFVSEHKILHDLNVKRRIYNIYLMIGSWF